MALEKIGISMFWSLRDRRARNTDRSLRLPRRTNDGIQMQPLAVAMAQKQLEKPLRLYRRWLHLHNKTILEIESLTRLYRSWHAGIFIEN